MSGINNGLFDFINDGAGHSHALDQLAKFGANDLIFVLGVVIVLMGLWLLLHDFRLALQVGIIGAIAVGASLLVGKIISDVWFEARPFVDHPTATELIKHAADAAFPSDHCLVAGAAATVAILAWRWWGLIPAAFALLIAYARVFVGVHYPGDVLAGLAIGVVCALVAWYGVEWASRRLGLAGRVLA